MKRVVEWTLMPDSNLSGVSIPRQRGMVNPHSDGGVGCNDNVAGNAMECDDVSDADCNGKVYAPNSDNALNDGKVDVMDSDIECNALNAGKVCIRNMECDDVSDADCNGKCGKVCIRVGSFAHWLHHNEPDAVDEHRHYTAGGGTLNLEQWVDVHHPELREIWAIVRYRGDI